LCAFIHYTMIVKMDVMFYFYTKPFFNFISLNIPSLVIWLF